MQQQNGVYITSQPTASDVLQHKTAAITKNNLAEMSIYLAVRQAIEPTWINNRDQFLKPNEIWLKDEEFVSDCLSFSLFHNNIQSQHGENHWIPFTEQEVNAQEKFASNFMTDFINGKLKAEKKGQDVLFGNETESIVQGSQPRQFSAEATAVFDTGRALWKYYHQQKGINVNASLYDIREHFQGRNNKGTMNSTSPDEHYMLLIGDLRAKLNVLAGKIKPKIYEYGFLKE